MVNRVVAFVSQMLGAAAILCVFIMIISTVADVSGRYLFNSPILGTVELNRTLLVFTVFFTLGLAQLRRRHIRVDAVLGKLPVKARVLADSFALLLALVFVGMVTYGSAVVAYDATIMGEYETGIINFPMWPGRVAIAIGMLILCIQYMVDVIAAFRPSFRKS